MEQSRHEFRMVISEERDVRIMHVHVYQIEPSIFDFNQIFLFTWVDIYFSFDLGPPVLEQNRQSKFLL